MTDSLMRETRKPLKIGVRLEPPAIVYIYSELDELRMRVMPLRNIWAKSDTDFVCNELQNRHDVYLENVPKESIEKMINIVKQHKQGMKLKEILKEYDNKNRRDIKNPDPKKQNKTFSIKQQKKMDSTFLVCKNNDPLNKFSLKTDTSDQDQFEVKRNIDNKNMNNKFPLSNNKKSNFSFGKNNSSSDSDEFEYENNHDDLQNDSENGLEVIKFLKEKELNKNKYPQSPSNNTKFLDNFNRNESITDDFMKSNKKNIIQDNPTKIHDNTSKINSLKTLLDVHDKIESVVNSKISKSEDDTDVEFDDSDIPLEEDFY